MYDHFNLCVILDCTTSSESITNSAFFYPPVLYVCTGCRSAARLDKQVTLFL